MIVVISSVDRCCGMKLKLLWSVSSCAESPEPPLIYLDIPKEIRSYMQKFI